MKAGARFNVSDFINPSGDKVFRVAGIKSDGTRVRKNFQNLHDAEVEAHDLNAAELKITDTPRVSTRLSPADVADAEAALLDLEGKASLVSAVRFYKANYRPAEIEITLKNAFDRFLAEKAADARPETIKNLRFRVGAFVTLAGPERFLSEVSPANVDAFINRSSEKPRGRRTKINDRLALSSFFSWAAAEQRRFCKSSPVPKAERIKVDARDPEILSLEKVRTLLTAAKNLEDGRCLPNVVLGLFCGLRPTEIARINWKRIDLEKGEIIISGEAAKTRGRRLVEISANAVEWLTHHALRRTPLSLSRGLFERLKAAAGIPRWPQDVLRHTAISHHFNKSQHEGETAKWAGNSPNVIHKHYKSLVPEKDSLAYWEISPKEKPPIPLPLAV